MSPIDFFSDSFESARERFLVGCSDAGSLVRSYEHPLVKTPNGAAVFSDITWFGDVDAAKVLITCSGTHGVEGFYGSAVQLGWILERGYADLPRDVAVLHIHAINPYGFAWGRRVNEENIDLNRNFFDPARIPENTLYSGVHDFIVPPAWNEDTPAWIQRHARDYVVKHGQKSFNAAVMGGQHSHADGLYYGGLRPAWSNNVIQQVCISMLAKAQAVAILDLHTGLGPFGHAEMICRHPPDSEALKRARSWFGQSVTSPAAGNSSTPPVDGNLRMAFVSLCAQAEVTAMGIEVGTLPLDDVLMALYADNWLYAHGDPTSSMGDRVRTDMRRAFFPDSDEWKLSVYARSIEIVHQAIDGLTTR